MNKITYAIMACHPDKGMKSLGSKGLIDFNHKKLFEYQLEWIKKIQKNKNYEIILICDFDFIKIKKIFANSMIRVYQCHDANPIFTACLESKYDTLICIDYGCLFRPSALLSIQNNNTSAVLCVDNDKYNQLDTGCIAKNNFVEHIFFDLPSHKFSNIFLICGTDKLKILNNQRYKYFNLLYFEILNMLIDSGSSIKLGTITNKDFIYFTQMRQKNAINRFIKNINN